MAQAYWVEFAARNPGCVEADTPEEAQRIAAEITGASATSCKTLPYPAEPRLNKVEGKWGATPSFCFTPRECAGHTYCHRRRACDD